uniref:Integral membrane protein n=2 Tax=unclassified Mycobacterium TaxID=2642494 RepID=A0A5Q5BKN3_MYCSS
MAKHAAAPRRESGMRTRLAATAAAMAALALFVVAMIASYSGAFANPTLRHLDVAVAAPPQVLDAIRGQDALAVTEAPDASAARDLVYQRRADAGFAVGANRDLTIFVAGGGGRSVVSAAESVGRAIATEAGLTPLVEDVAPTSAADPSGTVEFYAVIFLSIGASVGATILSRLMGPVRTPRTLGLRTLSLAGYSALLAAGVTAYVDGGIGALTGHTWQLLGALWLYAMAVGGAITGVAAALGTVASLALTLFLVIVGNAAAAGPVGRPLLSGFYRTFTHIVPQGSGVDLLRSLQYFDGNGATTAVVTLAVWAAAGAVLATLATVASRAYRSRHDGFARS